MTSSNKEGLPEQQKGGHEHNYWRNEIMVNLCTICGYDGTDDYNNSLDKPAPPEQGESWEEICKILIDFRLIASREGKPILDDDGNDQKLIARFQALLTQREQELGRRLLECREGNFVGISHIYRLANIPTKPE